MESNVPGSADANLVLAVISPNDALHARAQRHVAQHRRLRVSPSVSAELFMVLHRRGIPYQEFLAAMTDQFDVEGQEVLQLAAQALDEGILKTPMDAIHAADAWHRGEPLHTADKELLASGFPTMAY